MLARLGAYKDRVSRLSKRIEVTSSLLTLSFHQERSSTSESLQRSAVTSEPKEFPVTIPVRLEARTKGPIVVQNGDFESIRLWQQWPEGALPTWSQSRHLEAVFSPAGGPDHGSASSQSALCITTTDDAAELQLDQADVAPQPRQRPPTLHVEIPSRYCDVILETQGGSVSIEGVNEAQLAQVTTNGGDANLGKLRALEVHCNSGGGSVHSNLIVARTVSVQGQFLKIGKLMGQSIMINAQGPTMERPAIEAQAVYAEGGFKATSGQGDIRIGTLSTAEVEARLQSSGAVHVDCFDGTAQITCGQLHINCQDGAKALKGDVSGDIRLSMTPKLASSALLQVTSLDHGKQTLSDLPSIGPDVGTSGSSCPVYLRLALPPQRSLDVSIASWTSSLQNRINAGKLTRD